MMEEQGQAAGTPTQTTSPENEEQTSGVATQGDTGGNGSENDVIKLNQSVEIQDVGPCKKHIKVTIQREDIDKILEKKYSELVHDAPVPGFRPGKAPRRLIEKKFQKDVRDRVRGEVLLQSL